MHPDQDNSERARLYGRFRRAAQKHQTAIVVRLIREHPELHEQIGEGAPFVFHRRSVKLLEAAFAAGLHPDAGSQAPCQTLLQSAVCRGDLDRMRLLLRYGADPERTNDWGEVALGYACSWGQLEAAKLLVEAGAHVNAIEVHPESGRRNTPLDCCGRYPEIAAYLREHGAKTIDELEGEEG